MILGTLDNFDFNRKARKSTYRHTEMDKRERLTVIASLAFLITLKLT
jgi:hypothetical protein